MTVSFVLRPFEDQDREAVVAVQNATTPEPRVSVDEGWQFDRLLDETQYIHRRSVAVTTWGPDVVGYGAVRHMPWMFHPQKFWMTLMVHPGSRRRGIGTALYERLMEDLRSLQAIAVRAEVRENQAEALAFLQKRGFAEYERELELRLAVTDADLAPLRQVAERVAQRGIVISTLANERQRDSDCLRKLYELDRTSGDDSDTPASYEEFVRHLDRRSYLSDAFFIAILGDLYVGWTRMRTPRESEPGCLRQSFTGVRREYRRQGIALVLKMRTIEYARQHGYTSIITHSPHPAMIALNEKLGFRRGISAVGLEKRLGP